MAHNQPLNPTILGDKSHRLYSAYRELLVTVSMGEKEKQRRISGLYGADGEKVERGK